MQGGVTFRKAMAGDLPAIVALLADDELGKSREDPRLPLHEAYETAFRAIKEDINQLLAVAVLATPAGPRIVGCLQITFIPGITRMGMWRGQIEGVRIARNMRGQKVGEAMMQWAIGACKARRCEMIQLTTDAARPEARLFYEKLGFVGSHVGMKLAL